MDKYNLTPQQWEEKVTARLKEVEKSLEDGTAVLIPYEQGFTEIREHIQKIAEQERAKAGLAYEPNYSYESETATL